MANRRMFSNQIVRSDFFMDLPISAQALYFHLGMETDDRGYVSNPRTIIKMIGASVGDLEALINKKFVLLRENGLILIKHFKINNYIQSDRFKETAYIEDLKLLFFDENGSYTEKVTKTPCIQNGYKLDTQDNISKVNISNNNLLPHTCVHEDEDEECPNPTFEEVKDFIQQNDFKVNPSKFYKHYNSSNWMIGTKPIKNWKAVLRAWELNSTNASSSTPNQRVYGEPDWLKEYEENFMSQVQDL